jgi:hypothetical protein
LVRFLFFGRGKLIDEKITEPSAGIGKLMSHLNSNLSKSIASDNQTFLNLKISLNCL